MTILFKSATIIDPESEFHKKTVDVFVKNGTIINIAKTITETADKTIELQNLHI